MIRRLLGSHGDTLGDTQLRVLLLAGITAPLAVSLISPVFDALVDPLGATPSTIGLLVSAYTAPALVVIPLSGMLGDRYGRKPVLLAGLVIFGTSGAAISLTTDFRTVLALRALQGVGSAGISPVVITSIGDLYDDAEAAAGQGLRIAAVGGAQTVFPLLAGLLVVVAWQLPFLIYAMALPIALVVLRWFEEPAADAERAGSSRRYVRRLGRLGTRPRVLVLVVAYASLAFLYFGFQAYVSVHVVRVLGGTSRGAGVVVAVFSAVYALAATQAGRTAERFATRYRPLIGANAVMTAGVAGVAFAPTAAVAVLGGACFGAGYGIASSLYRSILPELAPKPIRAGLVGAAETLGRVGATVAPVVMGGLIAALEPAVGVADAVRWTVFAAGALVGLVGAVTVSVAALFDRRG